MAMAIQSAIHFRFADGGGKPKFLFSKYRLVARFTFNELQSRCRGMTPAPLQKIIDADPDKKSHGLRLEILRSRGPGCVRVN
jgi:hypothetical protein